MSIAFIPIFIKCKPTKYCFNPSKDIAWRHYTFYRKVSLSDLKGRCVLRFGTNVQSAALNLVMAEKGVVENRKFWYRLPGIRLVYVVYFNDIKWLGMYENA